MSSVLVVDDSELEREIAGKLLGQLGSVAVTYAADGQEALERIADSTPEIVVTDLQMPRMGGLELVTAMRASHPGIPVVLMTAFGSEETAAEAMRKGAASYVPKSNLARDLAPTVARTLQIWRAADEGACIRPYLVETQRRFVLDNDPDHVGPLVASLAEDVGRQWQISSEDTMTISTALHEAVSNALHHGNLEVDSALREEGADRYLNEIEARRHVEPYRERRIYVEASVTAAEARYVVRDDGKGYDRSTVPDPLDPANLLKASGRGLVLIQMFMDDVSLNDAGNEITMTKRRD
jgi:CheY-like chemotaxis protein